MRIYLLGILFLGTSLQAADLPELVDRVAGCFSVSYRYVEDGVKDKQIPPALGGVSDFLGELPPLLGEWVDVVNTENGVYRLQHYGIMEWDGELDRKVVENLILVDFAHRTPNEKA